MASNGDATTTVRTSLATSAGEECVNCGARLAPEQRYCVECGERRGRSRLPFAGTLEQRAQPAPAPPPKRPRLGANGALIAGIGTLVLALGVGVLIGRSGNASSGSKSSAVAPIIRIPATAATGTTGTSTATASASTGSKSKKASSHKAPSRTKKSLVKQSVQPPGSNKPPPAVTVGSPGHGKGYKNGKFTGDFFGG